MKKALSPLIATILLIVVAVALVAIILSWGSDFVIRNTSDADKSLDKDCVGAYINFVSCNFDSDLNQLEVNIVNSGKVNFRADQNFNVFLTDSQNNVDISNLNVLSSNALRTGESSYFVIEDYNGIPPITLSIRNVQCPLNYWETKCS
jgi:flagellin-like protein